MHWVQHFISSVDAIIVYRTLSHIEFVFSQNMNEIIYKLIRYWTFEHNIQDRNYEMWKILVVYPQFKLWSVCCVFWIDGINKTTFLLNEKLLRFSQEEVFKYLQVLSVTIS